MQKDRISFLRLISELENDLEILSGLMQKYKLVNNKIKRIKPDEFDWASLGSTIHNIYNLIENYLLRISKFFENNIDPSQRSTLRASTNYIHNRSSISKSSTQYIRALDLINFCAEHGKL